MGMYLQNIGLIGHCRDYGVDGAHARAKEIYRINKPVITELMEFVLPIQHKAGLIDMDAESYQLMLAKALREEIYRQFTHAFKRHGSEEAACKKIISNFTPETMSLFFCCDDELKKILGAKYIYLRGRNMLSKKEQ